MLTKPARPLWPYSVLNRWIVCSSKINRKVKTFLILSAACSGPVRLKKPGHPVQKASVPRSVCLLIYCHDGGSKKQLGVSKRETELLAKIKKQQEMLDKVMAEKEKVIMQYWVDIPLWSLFFSVFSFHFFPFFLFFLRKREDSLLSKFKKLKMLLDKCMGQKKVKCDTATAQCGLLTFILSKHQQFWDTCALYLHLHYLQSTIFTTIHKY